MTQRELSVPQRHQKKIALDTLRMSDAGARIMGGMTKEQAREFLHSIGYSPSLLARLDGEYDPTCALCENGDEQGHEH